MWKNRTAGLIVAEGSWGYWLWAAFMGIAWPLGIVLYGIGATAWARMDPMWASP